MKPIRRLPDASGNALYLTFDDGPSPGATEPVLEVLARHGAHATFFVIGQKARAQGALLERMVAAGHAIGNHSWDHGYSRFFLGKKALSRWIEQAERSLQAQIGAPTIGFRPPAGVRTPELRGALRELKLPLVLWNTRFYDTRFAWTRDKALRSLARARSGDIVLLHDRQSPEALPGFVDTLDLYLTQAEKQGFTFRALNRERLLNPSA